LGGFGFNQLKWPSMADPRILVVFACTQVTALVPAGGLTSLIGFFTQKVFYQLGAIIN
jgi:hypothetical protein